MTALGSGIMIRDLTALHVTAVSPDLRDETAHTQPYHTLANQLKSCAHHHKTQNHRHVTLPVCLFLLAALLPSCLTSAPKPLNRKIKQGKQASMHSHSLSVCLSVLFHALLFLSVFSFGNFHTPCPVPSSMNHLPSASLTDGHPCPGLGICARYLRRGKR